MNARSYKTVFSKRLGALVAVGEHATSQGKANGAGSGGGAGASGTLGYIAALTASFALVSLAWAAPATNALPTAGQVVQGAASMVQSSSPTASQLTINQSTQRAAINWQSFDIGAAAKVQVVQPNAQAVLLNRVVGQSPSQIFGQLQANGHVILVNPNGVLFGKDGSVNAGSFTASTLGITDADFMAGNMVYQRNGSTAGVVNQGTIQVSPGGYVALLGASVSNEGKIIAPQGGVESKGGVALGAAETIKVPVSGSGRIKLELTASDINASVSNTGQIVSEGGQVYMQALALNRAAAQVIQSGSIDTSGQQGGAVHLLADGGTIKVDGSITANSSGTDDKGQQRKGGDIVIGRDEETGVLARYTDVSTAKLESQRGFVETSGDHLRTEGVSVKAAQWLLDPSDITISSAADSNVSGTSPADITPTGGDGSTSVVSVSTIQSAINAGTSVTIKTTNASNTTGAGNITIANALAFNNQGGTDATLSLVADNGITQNAGASITTHAASAKRVNVSMTAHGNYQGNTATSASSQGVQLNSTINTNGTVSISGTTKNTGTGAGVQFFSGSGITTTTGSAITVNGTGTAGTTVGVSLYNTLLDAGTGGDVSITGSSFGNHGIYNPYSGSGAYNMKLVGRNVTLNGTSSGVGASGFYSYIGQSAGNIVTAAGDISLTGTTNGSGAGSALFFATTNWQTYIDSYTAGGSITFKGSNTSSANTATAIRFFGMQAKTTGSGNISVEASTQNASTNAITGLGFNPDLVWIKSRSNANWHNLFDAVRGNNRILYSNATNAEEVEATASLTSFNSDGFTLSGNGSSGVGNVNGNGTTYVAWAWDAGNTTVTNTQGSITSQVRANASAGFSIVSWTGNGSTLATVGHGLGVVPGLVILKSRDDGTYQWPVWHSYYGASTTSKLVLSRTDGTITGDTNGYVTSLTSTTFGFGGGTAAVNANTQRYIAYCFAPVAGYSSFGSYTGNGSADGPFVYTGFRPRWVMIKNASASANWVIQDTARSAKNIATEYLLADNSAAEGNSDIMDITSNGFKQRNTFASNNTNGATYIYFAFAESPFAANNRAR